MKISTPEPWDVQTSHAVYDLDNLRVDENDPSTQFVFAEFTLKHLVAYGVCHDKISQFPPNGLQLVLGDIGLRMNENMERVWCLILSKDPTLW